MSDSKAQESPTSSSLREQISNALMVWMLADKAKAMIESEGYGVVEIPTDAILSLVTTYIEASEINARIDELENVGYMPGQEGISSYGKDLEGRMSELQAQKAVLEEKH